MCDIRTSYNVIKSRRSFKMKTVLECIMERENNPAMIGCYVNLKSRMGAGDAHYAGELVEGAHIVTAWGDVGTELAIRLHGDESLFVGCLLYTSPSPRDRG